MCGGATSRLTANGCDNAAKKWSTGATLEQIDVSPNTTTLYSVTCIFSGKGCSATLTASTTLNPINFALTPATATTVCVGSPLTLMASGCPANGTIDWSEIQNAQRTAIKKGNKTNGTTYMVNPSVGVITYQAICAMPGLSCTQQVVVTTKAAELNLVAGNNANCTGGATAATLSYTATDLNNLPVTTLTVNWQGPSGAVSTPASVNQAGVYTAQTTYNGCSYSAVTTINYTAPTAPNVAGPSGGACPGQAISLTATGCDAALEWYTSTGTRLPLTGSVVTVTPATTTGYYARCRRSPNCASGNSNTVTIPVGAFGASASSTLICGGNSVVLSANCCAGPITWRDVTNSVTYAGDNAVLMISSLTATTQFQAQCGVGGVANAGGTASLTVTARGPLAYTATVACAGSPLKGHINMIQTGVFGLSLQYLLKRWNGSSFVPVGTWNTTTANLTNLTDGDYELSVQGFDAANPSVSLCQPPSTTLTVLCNCSFSAGASTTALNAGDEVSVWVTGVPFNSGNALHQITDAGTFRYADPSGVASPASLAGNFTWEAWVKPESPLSGGPNGSAERFVLYPHFNGAFFGAAANNRNAGLGIAVGTNGIRLAGHTSGYYQFLGPTYTPPTPINSWSHVAVVVNASDIKLYLNGVLSQTLATPINNSIPLALYPSNMITGNPDDSPGSGSYKGRYLGFVDEVRLWSVARSAADIQANYKRILNRSEDGLRSYWRFESATNSQTRSSAEANEVATLGGPLQIETNAGYREQADGPTSTFVWARQPVAFPQPVTGETLTDSPKTGGNYVYTATRQVNGINTACVASVTVVVNQDKVDCICDACNDAEMAQTDNPDGAALPSKGQNYVQETTYLTDDTLKALQTVSYADGLGRPVQQVQVATGGYGFRQATDTPTDIVTHMEYDPFGRQTRQYLPFALSTNKGTYRPAVQEADVTTAYTGIRYANGNPGKTGNAYTAMGYENSPLNRVLTQAMPGSSLPQQTTYRFNTAGEIRMFTVASPTLITVSTYGAGQLYVTTLKDENTNNVSFGAAS